MVDSLTETLRKTLETVEGVDSLDEWTEAVRKLPEGPRSLAASFAAMPDMARGLAAEMEDRIPEEHLELVRRIGERGREVGEEDELNGLLREFVDGEDEVAEAFAKKEDPLYLLRSESQISLTDGRLEIRVIGGADSENLTLDFTKTPLEVARMVRSLLRFTNEGLQGLESQDLSLSRFVDEDALREELEHVDDQVSAISERLA